MATHSHFTRLRAESLEDRRLLAVSGMGSGAGDSLETEQALELFATSPALFVENQGQWGDPSVRYLHSGSGASVAMTDEGVRFQLSREVAGDDETDPAPDDEPWDDLLRENVERQIETLQFSVSYVSAATVEPVGLDASPSTFNYFVGDQSQWRSEVPSYEKVAYEGLYPGIDLHTWGPRSHLKYEFHVAPGADWSQIQVRYDGISGLSLTDEGALAVDLGGDWGIVLDDAPYVYQVIDTQKVKVDGRFVLVDDATYAFLIGQRHFVSS